VVYRITGVFFFGAASSIGAALDESAGRHRALVIDFAAVPFLDSTAANTLEGIVRKAARRGVKVYVTGTSPAVRRTLVTHGVKPPRVGYKRTIAHALASARAASGNESARADGGKANG
jgi:SulP family sulfate permease